MARKKTPNLEELNRDKIAEIARELFTLQGFENTTMNDVAKKANISKSTLYVYFMNKEAVRNYLAMMSMNSFYEELTEKLQPGTMPVRQLFMKICDILLELKEKDPFGFAVLIEEICVEDEMLMQDRVLANIYEVGEKINQFIFSCFRHDLPHRSESDLFIKEFSLWGSIYGIITFADNKEKYLTKATGMTKVHFLENSFSYLFESVNWKGKAVCNALES